MIGKYMMMKRTNPIRPGVTIPALRSVRFIFAVLVFVESAYLSGRVFFIRKKVGNMDFRMMTKAWPPKYV